MRSRTRPRRSLPQSPRGEHSPADSSHPDFGPPGPSENKALWFEVTPFLVTGFSSARTPTRLPSPETSSPVWSCSPLLLALTFPLASLTPPVQLGQSGHYWAVSLWLVFLALGLGLF